MKNELNTLLKTLFKPLLNNRLKTNITSSIRIRSLLWSIVLLAVITGCNSSSSGDGNNDNGDTAVTEVDVETWVRDRVADTETVEPIEINTLTFTFSGMDSDNSTFDDLFTQQVQ